MQPLLFGTGWVRHPWLTTTLFPVPSWRVGHSRTTSCISIREHQRKWQKDISSLSPRSWDVICPEFITLPVSKRKLQPKTTQRHKYRGCSTFNQYVDGQNSNSITYNVGTLKKIYYLLESIVLLSICLITGFQWLGAHRPFALNFTLIFMTSYYM